MTQFRPIALCNTVAKIISKMLARRLKGVLPSVISESQSAFVPDRLITDNVLLAYEAHHFIKHRKQVRMGYMSIKLDMLNAYDRIEWSFLRAMLRQSRFGEKCVPLIMEYVESVTYSVLVNGEQTGFLQPGRFLRQGDPLSPYLFIICTEGLISLLKAACSRGDLQGVQMGQGMDPLTHLMLVDDTFLYGHAIIQEAHVFKSIFHTYEHWSGQLVSVQKSAIQFSPNVDEGTREAISRILGMPEITSHGTYLGLPTTIGASKKAIFNSIIDRAKVKVVDWKPSLLSKAGMEVFIKSVLQAIPTYTMQCCLLPIQTCNSINVILAKYWWGQRIQKKQYTGLVGTNYVKQRVLVVLAFRISKRLIKLYLACKSGGSSLNPLLIWLGCTRPYIFQMATFGQHSWGRIRATPGETC
ncbi:hypothetical protein LIER_35499 [Lithospermum erythrorhizon]|uniref:Reverse transcriptase domain-containing protein n=1 Tax=Lithospermum erythrorhizon TaxID=34254 RepID=A0AAV3NSD6_LITER